MPGASKTIVREVSDSRSSAGAPHVGVAAEAVDQQQRMPVTLLADVEPQAADGHAVGQAASSGSQA